jgi:predicted MPP superfamily phosphohydrolase
MLTWLHFSDLHFCPLRTGRQAWPALEKMLQDLRSLQAQHGLRPDLIFFTGDAAYGNVSSEPGGALADQFALFGRFLEALLATFHPPLAKEQLFLVPGNHDVDRDAIFPEAEYLDRHLLPEAEKLLREGGPRLELYLGRLAAYRTFLKDFGLSRLLQDEDRLTYGLRVELAGSRIGIGGFNTAWNSGRRGRDSGGDGDRGRIWMAGSWQRSEISPLLAETDLRIALLHHPNSWLRAEEDPRFWRELKSEFHFVLHGHQHGGWIESSEDGAVVLSASASFQAGERGYNLVQIDPLSLKGSVWLRAWDERGAAGWIPFLIKDRTDDRGVWPLRGRRPKLPPESQVTVEDHRSLVEGLLQPIRDILREQTIYDFRYFSSALDGLAEAIHRFIRWADGMLPGMEPELRRQARETAQHFLDLPVRTEKAERLTELVLREKLTNHNAQQLQIILLEYAERFTTPLGDLIDRLEAEGALALSAEGREDGFSEALRQLTQESGVARFQGLLSLLRTFRGRLLRALDPTTVTSHLNGKISLENLLDAFWGSFDLVLTEERSSHRGTTEVVVALLAHNPSVSVRKMLAVLQILDGVLETADAVQKLKERLWRLEESPAHRERDLKVALRALTLHQAQSELRKAAVRQLDDDSAWRLLSMSKYPRNSTNEIAEWILEREAPLDRHRILFDLQHDDFLRSITRREAADVIEIQRFLLLIKSSPIMREGRYYWRYRLLLKTFVESLENTLFLDKKILETYAMLEAYDSDTVRTSAEGGTPPGDEALAGLDELAFRRLLLEPIYFFAIIKHPRGAVWQRVLQNLDIPGIAVQCLTNHSVSQPLFNEIFDKEQRLFEDVRLKKLWALNPRAAQTLLKGDWILRTLPRRDLEEVARNLNAAGNVRQRAKMILEETRHSPRRG